MAIFVFFDYCHLNGLILIVLKWTPKRRLIHKKPDQINKFWELFFNRLDIIQWIMAISRILRSQHFNFRELWFWKSEKVLFGPFHIRTTIQCKVNCGIDNVLSWNCISNEGTICLFELTVELIVHLEIHSIVFCSNEHSQSSQSTHQAALRSNCDQEPVCESPHSSKKE